MSRARVFASIGVVCVLTAATASSQGLQSGAPSTYAAVTDIAPRVKPPLPVVGATGSAVIDPAFGSTLWRVTDAGTRPGALYLSYRTPSGTHQNAWSASGRLFYVVSTDGTIVPFTFDASTGHAARVSPTSGGDGGLVLRFYIEPTFSYVTDGLIYGSYNGSGATLRTIDQFDFATGTYTRLLDLDTLVPGLAGTYVGGLEASAGPVERIITFFGGASQDRHHLLVVFDKQNPANRRLLDTQASTLDGTATNIALNFNLHAAAIDRSGRYVTLYPTGADRSAPRSAAPGYEWDTETDTFVELPSDSARSNGHDAYGYGVRVNQDCCTTTSWDAAQWQLRSLATPLLTRDLILPVLTPKEIYLAEHPSWHNAAEGRLVPYITALYRYGDNTTAWRAWDDEIVGVQTDVPEGTGAIVWRFAHHRSDTRNDSDPTRISFWYTPRPNVSPDGRWVLFTSNWEKTLGVDPRGEPGGTARQDVFLLALPTPAPSPNLVVTAFTTPVGVSPGVTFKVTDTIANTGSAPAGGSTVRYYLSTDATLDTADIRASGKQTVGDLAPGVSFTGTVSVKVPASTPTGWYWLAACADDLMIAAESSESDNCLVTPSPLLVDWPDLVTTAIGAPPVEALTGTSFTVSATVANLGNVPSRASATRFYLSADLAKGDGDMLLAGTLSAPTLAPGTASTRKRSVTIPLTTAPGTYHVIGCADDADKLGELDDTNNCLATSGTVTVK